MLNLTGRAIRSCDGVTRRNFLRVGSLAIGATNSKAEYPISNPQTPGCVLATMYEVLGVDYTHIFYDQAKRPLRILAEGKPIRELVG